MTYGDHSGEWKVGKKNPLRLELKLNKKDYVYRFDKAYTEAVLVKPDRTPRAKIRVVPADDGIR